MLLSAPKKRSTSNRWLGVLVGIDGMGEDMQGRVDMYMYVWYGMYGNCEVVLLVQSILAGLWFEILLCFGKCIAVK